VCGIYICQCVKQAGFEKQQRKRERELGELQSEVQFPAFARERLDPGFKALLVVLSLRVTRVTRMAYSPRLRLMAIGW